MSCSRAACSEPKHTSRSCWTVLPAIRSAIVPAAAWQVFRMSTLGMPDVVAMNRCDPRIIGTNGKGMLGAPMLVVRMRNEPTAVALGPEFMPANLRPRVGAGPHQRYVG